jgi:hypothetical protein
VDSEHPELHQNGGRTIFALALTRARSIPINDPAAAAALGKSGDSVVRKVVFEDEPVGEIAGLEGVS